MNNVRILWETTFTENLVDLFLEASKEKGSVLFNPSVTTREKAKEILLSQAGQMKDTTKTAFCFTKIFVKSEIIGFSLVNIYTPEYRKNVDPSSYRHRDFNLIESKCISSLNLSWYRLGYFFVKPEYRGDGVGSKTLKEFCLKHKCVIYQCDENNTSSLKLAYKFLKNYGLQPNPDGSDGSYYTFFSL